MGIKKLTEEEILEVEEYIEVELPDPEDEPKQKFVKGLSKSKDHPRDKETLQKFEAFQRKVERGEVKTLRRTEEGYEEVNATTEDIEHITRHDRDWTTEKIEKVMRHEICPSDLHLYSDDFGTEEVI